MAQVTILLCGPPHLDWAGRTLTFERRKALALVAYLAMARAPVSRDELATLLWPELGQDRARAALRSTLPALTGAAPAGWIVADRNSVSLRHALTRVDAEHFAELLAAVRSHAHREGLLCAACALRLGEAAALYRGEFLQGFHLPASPDFEAWQLAQREALRHELVWALRALASHHGGDEALAYGRRWVELDPLNEAAHRTLMEHYAAVGRRGEALRQYRRCADLLHAELGVTPAPETTALSERIARAEFEPAPAPSAPQLATPDPLPAEPGSFVGREVELAWLVARLSEPDCRLVTLTGPGGIGKTRLALRAAAALGPRFAGGARLVALSAAHTIPEAVSLISAAVDLTATRSDQPLNVLGEALSRRELLLVLDNLEQIPGAAELILNLLTAAPALRLLVTSRERLALRAESVLPLSGLAYPDAQADSIAAFSAVQLFVQRARQVRPDFALSAVNQAAVARICALVEGMPLGLELAAAWARSLSADEIADEIGRGADFLRAAVRDLPERHRSLRAVFAHSWQLLSPSEQAAYRRLAVFQCSFSSAAAHAIADLSLADLASLADKSLLRRNADGRYDFHPLIRQYAAERLAEDPAEEARLRHNHSHHFAALVARHAPALHGSEQTVALAALTCDGPNLRAAWAWAVTAGDLMAIGLMLDGLAHFCELRSYRQEGETALAHAEALLAPTSSSDPVAARLHARVLAWRGHFCQFLGRYDDSEAMLERSLDQAQNLADRALIAFCHKGQGINANARGDHQRAIALHQASLALYEDLGNRAGMGDALNRMGGAAFDLGDLPMARRCWQDSQAIYEQIGDLSGVSRALNNLGEVCRILGDYAEARRLAEASLALHANLGPGWGISPRNSLALLARYAGRFDEARQLHERSLAICHAIGDLRGAANTMFFLGELDLAVGRLDTAEGHLKTSLRSFQTMGQRQGISACLTGLAELAIRRGAYAEAAALARESLALAEAIPARLSAGRAMSSLGLAQAFSGEPSAAATLAAAEATLIAIGAHAEIELVAARRAQVGC